MCCGVPPRKASGSGFPLQVIGWVASLPAFRFNRSRKFRQNLDPMKKVGRNDPCPCGSGKKYKHCCIDKHASMPEHPLSDFNKHFLLNSIAHSFLLAENYGKDIRLQKLMRDAYLHSKSNGGITDIDRFSTVVRQHYMFDELEDPPTHLFTDLVTFYGGDYLVLSGISEGGAFILRNLLTVVNQFWDRLPREFRERVYNSAQLLLWLSDRTLRQAGLDRYSQGVISEEHVTVTKASLASSVLHVSREEIYAFARGLGLNPFALAPFFLPENANLQDHDHENNPFIIYPLLPEATGVQIANPAGIVRSLVHFIIKTAQEHQCLTQLLEFQADRLQSIIHFQCQRAGYELLQPSFISQDSSLPFRHQLYRCDTDKLVYITLKYDSGHDYNAAMPFATVGANPEADKSEDLSDRTLREIQNAYPEASILLIRLFHGLGRMYSHPLTAHRNLLQIRMPLHAFEVVTSSKDTRPLELWYFASAKKALESTTQIMPLADEIDTYAFYKNHDDSFYFNDSKKPSRVTFQPGICRDLIAKTVLASDEHSIGYSGEAGLVFMPCTLVNPIGVYAPLSTLGQKLHQGVECYRNPVWVEYSGNHRELERNQVDLVFEFIQALAFWLYDIAPSLRDVLSAVAHPVVVEFNIFNLAHFGRTADTPSIESIQDLVSITYISAARIHLSIPIEITKLMEAHDNRGDRELVRALLRSVDSLLQGQGLTGIGDEQRLAAMMDMHAPVGPKKMMHVQSGFDDIRLNPTDLIPATYLSRYRVNEILDSLVPAIRDLKVIATGFYGKVDSPFPLIVALTANVLLPQLISEIRKHDAGDLIERLLSLNETLIQKRRFNLEMVPMRVACYGAEADVVKDLNELFHKIDQTALSVRCLIEHVNVYGKASPSRSNSASLDYMLALMEQIISWGGLGDQIKHQLFDVQISILKSERIGTSKSLGADFYDPFRMDKAKEAVTDAITDYEEKLNEPLSPSKSDPISESLNRAFRDEYGVGFWGLIDVMQAMAIGALIEHHGVAKMTFQRTVEWLEGKKLGIPRTDIIAALKSFMSLERKSIAALSSGTELSDVFPWRFNRRLSLMRRPIVSIGGGDNPTLYWGARQVWVALLYLLHLYYTSKLRTRPNGLLSKLIGSQANRKGNEFRIEVASTIRSLDSDLIVDEEVGISPHGKLKAAKDLGDVDILVLDKSKKEILLVETKNIEYGKNVKEIVEEIETIFGSGSKKGWIGKHEARVTWVTANRAAIAALYSIDCTTWKVRGAIVTPRNLAAVQIRPKDVPFPIVSLRTVEQKGLAALRHQ